MVLGWQEIGIVLDLTNVDQEMNSKVFKSVDIIYAFSPSRSTHLPLMLFDGNRSRNCVLLVLWILSGLFLWKTIQNFSQNNERKPIKISFPSCLGPFLPYFCCTLLAKFKIRNTFMWKSNWLDSSLKIVKKCQKKCDLLLLGYTLTKKEYYELGGTISQVWWPSFFQEEVKICFERELVWGGIQLAAVLQQIVSFWLASHWEHSALDVEFWN